jgi:hypothetical protein
MVSNDMNRKEIDRILYGQQANYRSFDDTRFIVGWNNDHEASGRRTTACIGPGC